MLAPAKINLYLNIIGKREDGYHLLESLIAYTDICDEIAISPSQEFELDIQGPFSGLVENDEHNIVVRAFRLMQQECNINSNVAISLTKNIPVGAGLGGGSSDAATTLIMLNELWNAGLPKEKLLQIGLKLGADVPVFLNRNAAFVSGIGEKITDAKNLPNLYAILVYPDKVLSTKEVFEGLSIKGHSCKGRNPKMTEDYLPFIKSQKNDLEPPAIKILPEIKKILNQLSQLDGCEFSRMTGSGSTCFAIFTDKNKAEISESKVTEIFPEFWVRLVKVHT